MHSVLADEFRSRIASGRWPEGERAPSEAVLCREFGLSRGPVRQALSTLRAEGLIVGGRGRPPLVRRNAVRHAASALGSFTAWAIASGHTPGQRTVEQSRRRADVEAAERLQVSLGDPVVTVRRVRYLDGEPVMFENQHFAWDLGRLVMDFDPDSGSLNSYLAACGADLYASTHEIDAVAASADEAADLDVLEGSPLLRVSRTTVDSVGAVVEYADDLYVPGLTAITFENRLFGPQTREGTTP